MATKRPPPISSDNGGWSTWREEENYRQERAKLEFRIQIALNKGFISEKAHL